MAVRLERIKKEYGDAVSIEWKSFLLRPHPEPKPLDRFRRYTESWQVPAAQPDGGRFRVWSTDEAPPSHSIPPNLAVKAAARQSAFDRYHLAVMDAYFYENRNVTDVPTLVDIAVACGLDRDRFASDVGDPVVAGEVVADHREALERGVSAVPTIVVDGELQVPGAQDLSFYRRLLDKKLGRSPSEER